MDFFEPLGTALQQDLLRLSSKNISDSYLWWASSDCVRDTRQVPLSLWGIVCGILTLKLSPYGGGMGVIFQPVNAPLFGVTRLTYHLLGLFSDQICSIWREILSQWGSWALVTTLQCFINRDSCVIHSPGLLADGHVMTADRHVAGLRFFFFVSSPFSPFKHAWANHKVVV